MFKKFGILFSVLMIVVLAGASFAFAASIQGIPEASIAGEGKGAIAGYTASAVKYTIDSANHDPAQVDDVSFVLTGSATTDTVTVKLDESSSNWYACTWATGAIWTCDTTGLLLGNVDELRVIAYQGITVNGTPMP